MKALTKFTAVCAFGLIAAAHAAPTAATNLVQSLNFQLVAWSQGQTLTNGSMILSNATSAKIVTKDIIRLLGAATTNTFSPNAQLLVIRPLHVSNAVNQVIVRDKVGTNVTRVDVSGFFHRSTADYSVTAAQINTAKGTFNGSFYRLFDFTLQDDGMVPIAAHFEVSGFGISTFTSLTDKSGKVIGEADEGTVSGSGMGERNGKPLLLEGSIGITGKIVEVD